MVALTEMMLVLWCLLPACGAKGRAVEGSQCNGGVWISFGKYETAKIPPPRTTAAKEWLLHLSVLQLY